MLFYLGTHMPCWLGRLDVPLFVAAQRLRGRKTVPRAVGRWALDSGGFTELSKYGRWTVPAEQYAREAEEWMERIGGMDWAAIQDWMCEPIIINGGWVGKGKWRRFIPGTHLSVAEHQRRTVASYLQLRHLAPAVPWVPVLQGWECDDYHAHVEQYRAAGVDLAALPAVGLGSVCRRQAMTEAEEIVRSLAARGIRLHGFGFKTEGVETCARHLASADSLAWSDAARRRPIRLPGCEHAKCNNCQRWALLWRSQVLDRVAAGLAKPYQGWLFDGGAAA